MLQFYGLREHPFGVTPNPRFLYPSDQHREALASLIFGIENQLGFAALIAEPGAGKTTLLFDLLLRYRERANTVFVFNTMCSDRELLRHIVLDLQLPGIDPAQDDPIRLYQQFTAFVADRTRTKPVLIIIDEAQNLENSALETLRLLSNFEAADRKLLHIILAGQPYLGEKLRSPHLEQLLQRITTISRLQRFTPAQIEECIAYRLKVAGHAGNALFTQDAIAKICGASRGIPREINRICINALQLGFALRQKEINVAIIEEVLSDLNLSVEPHPSNRITPPTPEPELAIAEPKPAVNPVELSAVASSTAPEPSVVPVEAATVGQELVKKESVKAGQKSEKTEKAAQRKDQPGARVVPLRGAITAAIVLFALTGPVRRQQAISASSLPHEESLQDTNAQTPFVQTAPSVQGAAAVQPFQAVNAASKSAGHSAGHRVGTVNARSRVTAASSSRTIRKTLADEGESTPVRVVQARQDNREFASYDRAPYQGMTTAQSDLVEARETGRASIDPDAIGDPTEPTAEDISHVISVSRLPGRAAADGKTESNPILAKFVRPTYPPTAKAALLQGDVALKLNIAANGNVSHISVLSGDPLLAQAAKSAVQQWQYRPAVRHGTPTEAEERIIVTFRLDQDSN